MSEYLSKKAVLDAIETEQLRLMGEHQSVTGYHKRYVTGKYDGLNWVKHQIQSGAFNADESEVHRLREALELCRHALKNGYFQDELILRNALKAIDQALSTTSEPTVAERVREIWNVPNANGSYHAGITRTLNALGITIPGINAAEGDGNDA